MVSRRGRLLPSLVVTAVAAAICLLWTPPWARAQPPPVGFYEGMAPWYASDALVVTPELPVAGENTEICVLVVNPTGSAYNVVLHYSTAAFGIGAAFTQIGESPVYLPPYSNVRDCKSWVPPGPGPWSFQVRMTMNGFDDAIVERNVDMFEILHPLTPETFTFSVHNPTPSTATISLGLVPQLSGWSFSLSPDVIPNLPPGGEQELTLTTTPSAVMPVPGTPVVNVEAYIGGEMLGGFVKVYTGATPCDGVRLDVMPPIEPVHSPTHDEQRGIYVTAIRGFHLCAVGMRVNLDTPQQVTARIYEADGTTRGTLLAQATATAVGTGIEYHYVPIDFELLPCQDYDIAFEYGAATDFYWRDERDGFEPFDLGGVIRIRDGEFGGNASNYALPELSFVGSLPGDYVVTDLTPEGVTWSTCADATTDRGIYVVPHQTISLSALGFEADFATAPVVVNAQIFESTAGMRGSFVAGGSATVTSSGLAMHSIPVAAVLEEGKEYDLSVTFPATTWSCAAESQGPLPFTSDGILSVNDGEAGGDRSNTILAHFNVTWSPGAGGRAFSLAKYTDVYPPPLITNTSNTNYGLFLTSLIRQEAYSLGWEADVKVGEPLYAWVFAATGTTRGELISTGSTVVVEGQTRWHDIPVAATLEPGADYNLEIGFGQTNAWAYWEDYTGMPYAPHGLFEVYATSQGGSINGHRLIHMRVNACNRTATGVDPKATHPPRFTLYAPYPNPVSSSASLGYSIDRQGRVTIGVYDVAGRRVAVLLDGAMRPAGDGAIELDASGLVSGVYFVKMEMGAKSVARKITVVR